MKRILIAHQSTIPHYRVPFYNALESRRPPQWCFDVVFDPAEFANPRIFTEPISADSFRFPLLKASTHFLPFGGKRLIYQTFWRQAAHYDLVILENALNNVTYPLCHLHQFRKTKIAYWGHERDRSVTKITPGKRLAEALKLWMCRRADGFFAYTSGVKSDLVERGVAADKIFVVNNTIDILEQRRAFDRFSLHRDEWRRQLGIADQHVMLFVGRFSRNKRLDFLFDACSILEQKMPDTHLVLVGSGLLPENVSRPQRLTIFEALTDLESLGPIYSGADVFVCPGAVGLAPLQALCYDLPVLTIDLPTHGPEIEYLNSRNSVLLPESTSPSRYAEEIAAIFGDPGRYRRLRTGAWSSIRHLTIDQMADRFVCGIDRLLSNS